MANSKARNLADFISTGAGTGILADGAVATTEITGVVATPDELNLLSGATVTTTELNTLDGVTVTPVEINTLSGVTGPIQAQIDAKAATSSLSAVATSGQYSDLAGQPSLGTAAALDVGTNANQVVQLDANAKLPAVDGGQLTNIQGYSIASALAFE